MNEVTDKIRRLLKLGESANEHEARLALAKAAELARKHSIDLGCVQAEETKSRVAEQLFECRKVFNYVESIATNLVTELFAVKVVFSGGVRCVGLAHNVATAVAAHVFIIEQCSRDLKAFRKSRIASTGKRCREKASMDYCIGWLIGAAAANKAHMENVKAEVQIEDSKSAIVLADQAREVEAYIAERYPSPPPRAYSTPPKPARRRKETPTDSDAMHAGIVAGKKVAINRPIEGGDNTTLRLEGDTAA